MKGIDLILALLILFGAYRGYREGFLMEILSLTAIVLGIMGGFKLMGQAMLMLKDSFDINSQALPYIAFAVVFLIIVILVSWVGKLIKKSIDKSFLGNIDQAAGALTGVLKMTFLLSVALWIISSLSIHLPDTWTNSSWLYPIVAGFAPKVMSWIGEIIPVFKDIL